MSREWSLEVCFGGLAKISMFGRLVATHSAVVLPAQYVEALALKTRYGQLMLQAPDSTWNQTCNCRVISGSGGAVTLDNHSEHAHSVAHDIRPFVNSMSDTGYLHTDFARFGLEDGVAWVMAWYRAGYRWGGIWLSPLDHPLDYIETQVRRALTLNGQKISSSRVDAMHFEQERSPTQVAAIDWAALIRAAKAPLPEEDWMAHLTDAQQDTVLTAAQKVLSVDTVKDLDFIRGMRQRAHDLANAKPTARPATAGEIQDGWDFADSLLKV